MPLYTDMQRAQHHVFTNVIAVDFDVSQGLENMAPTAKDVGVDYGEVLERLVGWASETDSVRAVIVTGSGADGDTIPCQTAISSSTHRIPTSWRTTNRGGRISARCWWSSDWKTRTPDTRPD
ncbi:hypothetical protein MA5S0422_2229 [Mycobacteroides abscessus 5S-0422]|uniref:Uncharacterized protein n=1 Tax=Mycobacteroides abscessus subsp. bolletii 1513 TaxID=1299321 RepID=X8DTS9_9MYCO|nr:hypothetical protein [Mycobacteroides abscessus]EIU27326.1 hypothetical protein MA5S0817_1406 [Mycobacteroides abscessus 5S-0817]EUA72037.1 hypothetical protein I540_2483 [Mycobacteroides abscessus subsp. bolletii 1513]EIU12522.1 hypothetical protein MA5S0304_1374 [Mycobacteroides abscessus 5S-0304]EIU14397.1 hypothetical protein MA5S0421_1626 [Mycobacteroides abscessus 5S-0421]EIU14900.1 hypothetical protein MA5S0422_2307 [Mycobacteroides abscessus 5S-0422]